MHIYVFLFQPILCSATMRKRRRSDSVLWQNPLYQQKIRKPKDNTQTPPRTSITQRLRTDLCTIVLQCARIHVHMFVDARAMVYIMQKHVSMFAVVKVLQLQSMLNVHYMCILVWRVFKWNYEQHFIGHTFIPTEFRFAKNECTHKTKISLWQVNKMPEACSKQIGLEATNLPFHLYSDTL